MFALAGLVLPLVGKIIDTIAGIFGDRAKAEQMRLQIELAVTEHLRQVDVGQLELNKAELAKAGWFFGGWRPAIGWCGALAIAYQFLLRPLWDAFTYIIAPDLPTLPSADLNEIIGLVAAMLGVAGLRTVEKIRGVAR